MNHLGGRQPIASAHKWLPGHHHLVSLHFPLADTPRNQVAPDDSTATNPLTPNSLRTFSETPQESYLSSKLLLHTLYDLLGAPGGPLMQPLVLYLVELLQDSLPILRDFYSASLN